MRRFEWARERERQSERVRESEREGELAEIEREVSLRSENKKNKKNRDTRGLAAQRKKN
jgi:hypothetical protein